MSAASTAVPSAAGGALRPVASFVPTASIDLGPLGAFVAASSRLGTHPDLAPVVFVGDTAPTLPCGLWSLTFMAALRSPARCVQAQQSKRIVNTLLCFERLPPSTDGSAARCAVSTLPFSRRGRKRRASRADTERTKWRYA